MREKFIIVSQLNGSELLRLLARKGKSSLGLRIMSPVELAEYALMRTGVSVPEKYIRNGDQIALVYSFLNNIAYFRKSSFNDARNICNGLSDIRYQLIGNEAEQMREFLYNAEFPEIGTALLQVYEQYIRLLETRGLIDCQQLIRRAASFCKCIDADFIAIEEYPLLPLEKKLLDTVSGGKSEVVDMCGLLGVSHCQVVPEDITSAYGTANEVEDIFAWIFREKLPLDSCIIAVTDMAKYSQYISDTASRLGLKVTFCGGIPVTNSLPARLLRNYRTWETTGCCGIDALREMVLDVSFDSDKLREKLGIDWKTFHALIVSAGNLRLSTDQETNRKRLENYRRAYPENAETASVLATLAGEFEQGCGYIVSEYAVCRQGQYKSLDRAASTMFRRELEAYHRFSGEPESDMIPELLKRSVMAGLSEPGCLYVADISGAAASLRENIFVAGLSAQLFPGTPSENCLITDNDFLRLDNENVPTSINLVKQRSKQLDTLLETAAAAGLRIWISFTGFDTAELKEENPSSAVFELLRQKCPSITDMEKLMQNVRTVGFFDSGISVSDRIGQAVLSGKTVDYSPAELSECTKEVNVDRCFSPTDMVDFAACPRYFWFTRILRMTTSDIDDPYTVISPAITGNLIHELLDTASKENLTRSAFNSLAERTFDSYLALRPPIIPSLVKKNRDTFLRLANAGFKYVMDSESLLTEEMIDPVKLGNITIRGIPDRLEKSADGKTVIADYKSGWVIRHDSEDTRTCIQALLYAMMLRESQGINVDSCEYRYLRFDSTVNCDFTPENEAEIMAVLEEAAEDISNISFPASGNCKKCSFSYLCKKEGVR